MTALDYLRLLNPGWRDALEIAVVAFACYRLLLLLHGTRAVQMLAGAVVLAALIALAARAPRLTAARLDELAALAAVVSGDEGHSGPQVTRRVLGVAQWALGRR